LRPSRRSLLIGGGALATTTVAGGFSRALVPRPGPLAGATPIAVTATPIDRLSAADPDRTRFGALMFRSGLELRSETWGFGGFSALWRSPDGRNLVAIADHAHWLRARIETAEGRLAGLSDAVLSPLRLEGGKALALSRFFDTESLAVAGRTAFVGVERSHDVIRFAWDGKGLLEQGRPVAIPEEVKELSGNGGLEAMGIAPRRSPLAGALVAVAERGPGWGWGDAPTRGFILSGPRQGAFDIVRSGGYEISDLAFLPEGELLLLERRFSYLAGFAIRLRRIARDAVKPGALVDGAVIFESDATQQIGNLEGLAVHREGRETILTLISDDNFNPLQRTLLLEFALVA